MELRITVSEDLLGRAREVAGNWGLSLEEMLVDYLRSLAGETSREEAAADLLGLLERDGGHSRGREIRREDAYEGRP